MFEDVILLVMTDGRDNYLSETLASAAKNLPELRIFIHDDSGNQEHNAFLAHTYPHATIFGGPRLGFSGSIQRAWSSVPECQWIFHLEDDFTFNEPVDLAGMITILENHPYLVQLAFLRQPWSGPEIRHGGVIGLNPLSYEDCTYDGLVWTEHRNFFTTNPSLYSYKLATQGWPQVEFSEQKMAARLFNDPSAKSAYYGSKFDNPRVHHIGNERSELGEGY
jgi:hypothetical protein